jgi:hypothetical protein
MDQDDNLKPISAFLRPAIESSIGTGSLTHPSKPTNPLMAIQRAKLMAGCYRKSDAADPETYLLALSAVLAEYPPDIVHRVTDPRTGLPTKQDWLPTVKEVRDACNELAERQRRTAEATAQAERQIRERREWLAGKKTRPTAEELKAQYGENWGLSSPPKAEEDARAERRKALQQRANSEAFKAECKRAGFPEDSQISPSLAALIKAGTA